MRFSKRMAGLICGVLLGAFFALTFAGVAEAAVGLSTAELQGAVEIILPSGESLETLEGYSSFTLQDTDAISGGISALYEARLLSDPWVDSELPLLQLVAFVYESQEAAESAFASLNPEAVLLEEDRSIFYQSEGGEAVDVFGLIDAEYQSFHWVHVNGNLIYQASIYRSDGVLNEVNLKTYAEAILDTSRILDILDEAISTMKLALGVLFPPTATELSAKSDKSSLNLSELYSIPLHGTLRFQLYIGEPEGAVGTILDSSGISTPTEGDIYLYLNSDGRLFAGIYAPLFDADCDQEGGWYRVETSGVVHPYEWNDLGLHFGAHGFWVEMDGEIAASCSVSQARSSRDVYFGDFPEDTIEESMIGYVENFSPEFSLTDSGLRWDDVLTSQLFLDLPNTDPDVPVFQFLKEEGVFLGSDGMLYPDSVLNRAEMVKILLKAFDYSVYENTELPFWDIPEDAWYARYVAKAYKIGMVKGLEDGSFLPAQSINRAEFFTMLSRVDDSVALAEEAEGAPFLDVSAEDWFYEGALYAYSAGVDLDGAVAEGEEGVGGTFFEPSSVITRREAAEVLYSILK